MKDEAADLLDREIVVRQELIHVIFNSLNSVNLNRRCPLIFALAVSGSARQTKSIGEWKPLTL
jgi:hypothetical protein